MGLNQSVSSIKVKKMKEPSTTINRFGFKSSIPTTTTTNKQTNQFKSLLKAPISLLNCKSNNGIKSTTSITSNESSSSKLSIKNKLIIDEIQHMDTTTSSSSSMNSLLKQNNESTTTPPTSKFLKNKKKNFLLKKKNSLKNRNNY
jgi:hypothetical protein